MILKLNELSPKTLFFDRSQLVPYAHYVMDTEFYWLIGFFIYNQIKLNFTVLIIFQAKFLKLKR